MNPLNWVTWAAGETYPRFVGPTWALALFLLIIIILLFVGTWIGARWVLLRSRSKNRLTWVWKAFLKNIPGEFRRYILLYQPFVVFGESGSGKSSLIGRYTDWKGQAAQFYPSYSVDPLLQIYLGSRALVQEVPATLLAETSPNARAALVRLWGPIFKKREPIAVVTVSAAALRKATPESLRSQAQVLRGKINVLSRIGDKPVQTRIVVTHMDQVEGYLAYSQFVEKNEVPHQLQLDPKAPDGNLAHCLEPQENYLPLALTSLSAKNYLKVLTFLNKAPETFENLGALLRALKEPDPLSFEPRIEDLYLTSDQGGSPSAISNPFAASWTDHHVAIEKAMVRRHGRITLGLVLAGLAYLLFAFFFERHQIAQAARSVAELEKAELKGDLARDAVEKIEAMEGAESSFTNLLLPNFNRGESAKLKKRYVDTLREAYLRPLYRQLETGQLKNAPEFALFLTGLIYASKDNELGNFILRQGESQEKRLAEWTQALTVQGSELLPAWVIKAYVELSDQPYAGKNDLPPSLYYKRGSWHGITEQQTWIKLVNRISDDIDRRLSKPIQKTELEGLKDDARRFREDFDALRRRRTGQEIFTLLKRDPHFPTELFQGYIDEVKLPGWLGAQTAPLDDLLDMVLDKKSTLDIDEVVGNSAPLADLNYGIDSIRKKKIDPGHGIRVNLELLEATIYTSLWDEMINAGKVQQAVEKFLERNFDARSKIFFAAADVKSKDRPILMRPPLASDYGFKGNGAVPANYTRAVYERDVQSKIVAYEQLFGVASVTTGVSIDTTKILDEDLRDRLDKAVQVAADEYAREYHDAWRKFYDGWSVEAHDVTALRVIVSQMAVPTSRFQEFLLKIRENTGFEGSPSMKLNAIYSALPDFRQLNKLQETDRGQNPEINKYRTILQGVANDLDGQPADKSKENVPATEMRRTPIEFDRLLSPVGRLSYAILLDTNDSKRKAIDEWLLLNGIGPEFQRPFLEPILQLHQLGLDDIAARVQKSWEKRVLSQAVPVLEKFPFNRNAVTDATPAMCEEALLPSTGLFWTAWRNLIAPVCVEDRFGWKPMPGLEKLSDNPKGMFDTVSALARVTKTLWEKDSVPRPLKFEIQPQPLPITRPGKPAIILSFLQSGKSSVFGFNQKVYSQTLAIEWWNRPTASIGMQVGDPGSNTKSYRAINEPESAWSFYRLLLRDRHAEQKVWVWDLTQGEPEYPAPLLKFQFKEDPWAVFAVPGFEKTDATDKKETVK